MKIEPSDITKLLAELGREDPTCHALRTYAERGEPVLNVCYEAIRILAAEKTEARKRLLEMTMLMPPPPMIVAKTPL